MAVVNMLSYGTGTNQGEKDRDDTWFPFIVFRLVLRNHIIFFVPEKLNRFPERQDNLSVLASIASEISLMYNFIRAKLFSSHMKNIKMVPRETRQPWQSLSYDLLFYESVINIFTTEQQ